MERSAVVLPVLASRDVRSNLLIEKPPKELFIGVYSPKRRLVEFQIEMTNVAGALAQISTELARLGISLCSGFLTAYPEKPTALFSFIGDMTDTNFRAEHLAEELSKLNAVLYVKFHEPKIKGLVLDDIHFPVLAIEERSIIFTVRTIGSMFQRLHQIFGAPAGVILYHMGLVAGKSKMENMRSTYGLTGRNALEMFLAGRVAKGWGIPEIVEFDEDGATGKIRVKDLFECVPTESEGKISGSHFFRGYLEGILNQVFGKEISLEEEQCRTKHDEYCMFVFRPR